MLVIKPTAWYASAGESQPCLHVTSAAGVITVNEDDITVKAPPRSTRFAPNKEYEMNIKLIGHHTHLIYTNSHHRLALFEGGSSVFWLVRVRGVGELDSPLRPFTAI